LKTTNLRKKDSFVIADSGSNVLSSSEPESTLGERICNARQDAGLTLNLASHLAGVKPSTLRDWERDRSEPRVNKLVALAGIFGVSPTHLMAEEGDSSNPVVVTKGRNEKIMALLKSEIADIEQQQAALTRRLSAVAKLLKKVK
jgi:transcriptional regulator with XRE-family HTH domain|tara:strand:- start:1182 stop:1613 length:432 start_codon:yes stop_codon:yes gene_type:complete